MLSLSGWRGKCPDANRICYAKIDGRGNSGILRSAPRRRRGAYTIRRSPRRPREAGARPARSRHCKRLERSRGREVPSLGAGVRLKPDSTYSGRLKPDTSTACLGRRENAVPTASQETWSSGGVLFRRVRRRKEHDALSLSHEAARGLSSDRLPHPSRSRRSTEPHGTIELVTLCVRGCVPTSHARSD